MWCLKKAVSWCLFHVKHLFRPFILKNMLRLVRAGAVILPPVPGFYHHPRRIEDLIDFIVARIPDQLRVHHSLMSRWGAEEVES